MLDSIDEYTHNKYTDLLEAERTRIWANYYVSIRDRKTVKEEKYREFLKSKPKGDRFKDNLTLYCPAVLVGIRKIKGAIFDLKYKLGKK